MKSIGLQLTSAVVVLLTTMVVATSVGAVHIPIDEAIDVLTGAAPTNWQSRIILDVRLPRTVLAAVAGGGLAVAGAVMQGLFRNPMADPSVLGVSGGAALGAVVVLYLAPPALVLFGVPLAAFVTGLLTTLVVYWLATTRGRTPVNTLLLAGIAASGITVALTSFVLSLSLADWEVGRQMLNWLMGGLDGRSWTHVALAAPLVLGGSAWSMLYARDLNVMSTGEESALAVGIEIRVVKRDLIVLTALITGATVAVMGVIGFIGLMVPHITRLLIGPEHRRMIPLSFVLGGIYLVVADILCRLLPNIDLRLGIVTALTGGPFFLFLLVRHRSVTGFA